MDFLHDNARRIALSAGLCLAVLAGVTATTVRPAAAGFVCEETSLGGGGSTTNLGSDVACGIADTANGMSARGGGDRQQKHGQWKRRTCCRNWGRCRR